MSRTIIVQDVPYGKDAFVVKTDCMDEGSFKYFTHRPSNELVMQKVTQRANMPLGLLIQNTLELAYRRPKLLEIVRGIERSESNKFKKRAKRRNRYDAAKRRRIEAAGELVEGARVAVVAEAPVDVGDEFGDFDFMNAVFDDDLSVCEDAFDELSLIHI